MLLTEGTRVTLGDNHPLYPGATGVVMTRHEFKSGNAYSVRLDGDHGATNADEDEIVEARR